MQSMLLTLEKHVKLIQLEKDYNLNNLFIVNS